MYIFYGLGTLRHTSQRDATAFQGHAHRNARCTDVYWRGYYQTAQTCLKPIKDKHSQAHGGGILLRRILLRRRLPTTNEQQTKSMRMLRWVVLCHLVIVDWYSGVSQVEAPRICFMCARCVQRCVGSNRWVFCLVLCSLLIRILIFAVRRLFLQPRFEETRHFPLPPECVLACALYCCFSFCRWHW